MSALKAAINWVLCTDGARVLLAVLLVGGTFALLLTDRDIPTFLIALDGAAIGFYFGGQVVRPSTS